MNATPATPQRSIGVALGCALALGLHGCGGGGEPADDGPAAEARLTSAWTYAVGGDTLPTERYPCAGASSIGGGLDVLRIALAKDLSGAPGACSAASEAPAMIDGRLAAVYTVRCNDVAAGDAQRIWNIASELEACWPGAGQRWRVGNWVARQASSDEAEPSVDLEMHIDPEPARLNAALSGKNSSASATYVYSGVSTQGTQWPGTWAVGRLDAGAPCATYAASAGTWLYSTIQASGSYRKCV